MPEFHTPVLLRQTLALLEPEPGDIFLDCTVGGGGHADAILEKILPGGRLIGIDRDQEALDFAAERLSRFGEAVTLVKANYRDLNEVLAELGISKVHGAVIDTGASSRQFDAPSRGFGFAKDGPLDMRMDLSETRTAADLVNELPERELARIIRENSGERWAARIARVIAAERVKGRIETTRRLAEIVAKAMPRRAWPKNIDPSTRTFLSLRTELNAEYEALTIGLKHAAEVLLPGGRLACITFQSIEDRIVKDAFAELSGKCKCPPGMPVCVCGAKAVIRIVTKKAVTPDEEEIRNNPRSRSAKLRAAEKLA